MSQQSNEVNDGISQQTRFDYSFRLFTYHADQRMRSFNFYIILLIASIGGTLTAFEKLFSENALIYNTLFLIGACHVILALIFWVIDIRGKRLVEVSRKALMWYENRAGWKDEFPSPMRDDDIQQVGFRKFISMTHAFRCAFSLHIIFGACLMFGRWL
jgi:hypothetical protein